MKILLVLLVLVQTSFSAKWIQMSFDTGGIIEQGLYKCFYSNEKQNYFKDFVFDTKCPVTLKYNPITNEKKDVESLEEFISKQKLSKKDKEKMKKMLEYPY